MTATESSFFERLQRDTASERASLVTAPIIERALRGDASLASYRAFLHEAFHHVRHTVPLLRACRARLPERLSWMYPALDDYIAEEQGHDQWILDDVAACGGDPGEVRAGRPGAATELMVAYAYDTIARGNPVAFFGMVLVLEGTSVALALHAADRIQACLGLPDSAFTYLRSHGVLDREHTHHLAALLDRLKDGSDQAAVVHAARMFYRLYGDVFRSLPLPSPVPAESTIS
ncbi:MAG TPA: iron-containing redox enzyme family protein [Casimicrobiaceae bacterium]|nr:iron-containing redox enzyme family protein [Casimicrobiaceae bacterium]